MSLISSTVFARTSIATSPLRSLIRFGSAFGFRLVDFFAVFELVDDFFVAVVLDFADAAAFARELVVRLEVGFFADAAFFSASIASRAIFRFLRKLCLAKAPLSAPGDTL